MFTIAALILSLLMTGSALPANAAPAAPSCSYGHACLYTGANYTGTRYVIAVELVAPCRALTGYTINNNAESIYGNYSNLLIRYWNSHNCSGSAVFWSSGGAYPTLPTSARNVISSYDITYIP